ncbi:hypothetical protein ABFA07_022941 [Porites harrisoni]
MAGIKNPKTIQPTKIPQPLQAFSLEKAGLNNPKTYGRLEKQGVCLSHTSMINLVDLMGGHFHDKLLN